MSDGIHRRMGKIFLDGIFIQGIEFDSVANPDVLSVRNVLLVSLMASYTARSFARDSNIMKTNNKPTAVTSKKKAKTEVCFIHRADGGADVILPSTLKRWLRAAAKREGISAQEMFERAIKNSLTNHMTEAPIFTVTRG